MHVTLVVQAVEFLLEGEVDWGGGMKLSWWGWRGAYIIALLCFCIMWRIEQLRKVLREEVEHFELHSVML